MLAVPNHQADCDVAAQRKEGFLYKSTDYSAHMLIKQRDNGHDFEFYTFRQQFTMIFKSTISSSDMSVTQKWIHQITVSCSFSTLNTPFRGGCASDFYNLILYRSKRFQQVKSRFEQKIIILNLLHSIDLIQDGDKLFKLITNSACLSNGIIAKIFLITGNWFLFLRVSNTNPVRIDHDKRFHFLLNSL